MKKLFLVHISSILRSLLMGTRSHSAARSQEKTDRLQGKIDHSRPARCLWMEIEKQQNGHFLFCKKEKSNTENRTNRQFKIFQQ